MGRPSTAITGTQLPPYCLTVSVQHIATLIELLFTAPSYAGEKRSAVTKIIEISLSY